VECWTRWRWRVLNHHNNNLIDDALIFSPKNIRSRSE
jgi:hypothetical protein